jgi:hypothetical protein
MSGKKCLIILKMLDHLEHVGPGKPTPTDRFKRVTA